MPEANFLTELDWRRLTAANLWEHPTVWVTILAVMAILLGLCQIRMCMMSCFLSLISRFTSLHCVGDVLHHQKP